VLTDKNEISTPPENSLEYYCSMMKSDYLFSRLPDFNNLIGIRLIVNKCDNPNLDKPEPKRKKANKFVV
jgi:hypothetical protein